MHEVVIVPTHSGVRTYSGSMARGFKPAPLPKFKPRSKIEEIAELRRKIRVCYANGEVEEGMDLLEELKVLMSI